jgi:hypothetical protein
MLITQFMVTTMTLHEHRMPKLLVDDGFTPPTPDNENLILSDTRTPAEALQVARRIKTEICGELIADPQLWNCPDHRETRDLARGVEQCALRYLSKAK